MTITREQVADLQPGDVVELTDDRWPETVIRGPLRETVHGLCVAALMTVDKHGEFFDCDGHRTLTVVSRAPRPLYVNHPRTEPIPGDVAILPRGIGPVLYTHKEQWAGSPDAGRMTRWVGLSDLYPDTGPIYNAGKLRLLVDGETGQVVPS